MFEPEKIAFKSFVGNRLQGKSLVDFLADRFTYFDREIWAEKIRATDVLVNNETSLPGRVLVAKDEVQYTAMSRPEPSVPTNISVLFEDEDLLIVNKPPHLPVHPGGRYLRNTLINLLKAKRPKSLLILAHRLDRETSGVCVLSKTQLAKDRMYWQFFNGEVDKTYWALTWGKPSPPSGLVDAAIGLANAPGSKVKSRIRTKQAVGGGESKSARTKYHTLKTKWVRGSGWQPPEWPRLEELMTKRSHGEGTFPISLIECKPITGRTNQIRVHLAHLGCGIVGDKLYDPDEGVFIEMCETGPRLDKVGSGKSKRPAPEPTFSLSPALKLRLVLDAHALHAKSLEFRHPRTGKRMRIDAPVPKSWQAFV